MHAAVDSGSNEIVRQMCELLNYGRVLVAPEVLALWLHSGDGRALRTHAQLAWIGEPYIPVCPLVGRKLGELSAGDLPQADFGPTSTGTCKSNSQQLGQSTGSHLLPSETQRLEPSSFRSSQNHFPGVYQIGEV